MIPLIKQPKDRSLYRRFAMVVGALTIAAGGATSAWTQQSQVSPLANFEREAGVLGLSERLASLTPARPMEYFELAEELAYLSASAPSQRATALRTARQLFVLAYELDRAGGRSHGLGKSVCLALADISPPDDRDWLLAMAASFGQDTNSRGQLGSMDFAVSEDGARADAAEALGRYRSVEGPPLSSILRRVEVRQQMREAGVSQNDTDWVMDLLERGLQRPSCPECRNQRLVRVGTADQTLEQRLCGTCFGNPTPDPPLSQEDLRRMLAVEAKLLDAYVRTWSAEAIASGGAPIPDLDPSALPERYGVSVDTPYWIPSPDAALLGNWSATPAKR